MKASLQNAETTDTSGIMETYWKNLYEEQTFKKHGN